MTAAEQAKGLGAKSLKEVADFYECSTERLRMLHKRKLIAFKAMVIGFVFVSNDELKEGK